MKIALLGLGTVGTGVVNVLENNKEKIAGLTGETLTISHVLVNNIDKEREVELGGAVITDDIDKIIEDDTIDIVIEVMGGIENTKDILNAFLEKGIHVVSANKDMLAEHIDELVGTANKNNAQLLYEASVAGGIPVIRGIEHSLNSNEITKVLGILNGTTNYILSKMTIDGWSYDQALDDAKAKGYAEADPTNDVEGIDAKRKIVLLSRLAYDRTVNMEEVPVTGISGVDITDIKNAARENLTLKLLGKSEFRDGTLAISVEPILLPSDHQLAGVNYEKNAVFVNGNAVGEAMFYGPGAGSLETASAVVSDLINVIRSKDSNHKNFAPDEPAEIKTGGDTGEYYVRLKSDGGDEKLESELDALSIGFRRIEADGDFVIRTQVLSSRKIEELKQNDAVRVEAVYQIDGVE
ncbi:homoserine dehydrogenase [Salinicoccus halodurans]|uniref:Homoserine dehydrogenase n=1 Tax=Salinicoccus halodurans TaxID=407035 RepID=A0A0F7HL28_9STAP|nr:homoserine dehydrogenase [Salinicoccus halodurans]AKG73924.1 homoserine dehydrogenase [Salinicoccus halodurans]SFK57860.1 homoserine dehydrogenase [Salinicoccus halodurans]